MTAAKYVEIARKIESRIEIGQYSEGSKLPTHRSLADSFSTTAVTVAKAYSLLTEMGLVESFVGRGSYVKKLPQLKQVIQSEREEKDKNFSILQPCFKEQLSQLQTTFSQIFTQQMSAQLFSYREDTGAMVHKEAGRLWCEAYGLEVSRAEQILLCNGAQHALSSLIECYSKEGDYIALEAQTYPGVIAIIKSLGRKPVAVSMDEHGMQAEALDEVCQQFKPSLVVVVPSHQNPTTVTMPKARRQAIAKVIQQHPVWLLEDDIYAFLNQELVPAITNLVPEKSFYISSLSKAISPGLRCGFIKAPQSQVSHVSEYIRTMVWHASAFMFECAQRLIESGMAFEMAAEQKRIAEQRQEIAKQMLSQALPDLTFQCQASSYHIWLTLPPSWQVDSLVQTAKEHGVLVSSGHFFEAQNQPNHSIRISLMAIADDAVFQSGLKQLVSLIKRENLSVMPI
ncbi:GntR family transcriptional regulator [Marinomonas sp. S3726]|uniref:aminotransferase-like domain-containing protein n=1 Tax=Marinomonas sp. S3726 TaxID=579484 RepID=UPI0005FA1799|nr:PLP-dependent aminotransferase family protein [Marinomonas sp. S3726]KJZ15383.1 GntR family transcriptional regulator [Marinomonas sp. S3726]